MNLDRPSTRLKEAEMTIKHWDDRELAKVSADLDAELEQLFDEMETVLSASPEEGPQLEFLPDDDEEPIPPRSRPSKQVEEQPLVLTRRHVPTEDEYEKEIIRENYPEKREKPKQAAAHPPHSPKAALKPEGPKEHDLPEAEVLPDDYGPPSPAFRETIANLSPDEFSRLMERAVARGVLAALKKWQRPARD